MHATIRALGKPVGKQIGQTVTDIVDEDVTGTKNQNRRKLFFEVEPFAREFDEYPKEPPVRENYDEFAEWINRRLYSVRGQGLEKYRAMFFGWLCYYHRDEAVALIKELNNALPLYEGHPDLTNCSDEAKLAFRRQEHMEEPEPEPEPESEPEPEPEREPDLVVVEPQSESDDDSRPSTSRDADISNEPRRKLSAITLGIVAVALLLVAGLSLYALGIFEIPKFASTENVALSESGESPNIAIKEPLPPEEETQIDDTPEGTEETAEEITEKELAQETSPPPAPKIVNPVWDQIPSDTWSALPLGSFRAWVQRANRSDLLQAARSGNRNAQTLAGMGYHLGVFGSTNHSVGLRDYLRPACDAGQGRACALVGAHYGQRNMGVSQNMATARSFYAKSCQLGNHMGCYLEGTRLLSGFAGDSDPARGYRQLGRSCDAGIAGACAFAIVGYSKGTLIEPNLELAKRYYLKAQRLGDPLSQKPFEQWLEEQRYYWGQPSTFRPQAAQ